MAYTMAGRDGRMRGWRTERGCVEWGKERGCVVWRTEREDVWFGMADTVRRGDVEYYTLWQGGPV